MAASLAKEAREAMAAPAQEEETPDAESVFAKLNDQKPDGESEDKTSSE